MAISNFAFFLNNLVKSRSNIYMQLDDISITSLFLSSIKYAVFLLIPLFSILKVATNCFPLKKLGKFLTESHNGNI
jgi:hypothetical protein